MTTKKKVLVTGASGLIGGLVVKHLGHKYDMSALNRRPVDGIPSTQASVSDFEAMLPAFEGIDMVVHMSYPTGSKDNWERHMIEGIGGTRNVFEAAQLSGVRRVVLGSTGETMMGYEREYPYGQLAGGAYDDVPDSWKMITYLDPVRPSSIYAACKVACEALGRYYSDTFDMSVLVIRLGVTLDTDMPKMRILLWVATMNRFPYSPDLTYIPGDNSGCSHVELPACCFGEFSMEHSIPPSLRSDSTQSTWHGL